MMSGFMLNFLAFCLIGVFITVSGCGGAKTSEPAAVKWNGSLNISLHQDPPKLDPSMSTAFVDRHVFQSLFDKLVDIDEKGKIIPMLAEGWEISADGKTYTLKLRKDVKFHDGSSFDAQAVLFNFERNLENASSRRNELKEVNKVSAVDNYTVIIELKQPFAPFLSILTDRAGMMVSPSAVKKYGADFAGNPVGTGPFVYKERIKGSSITLDKNPNYWQKGFPKADRIVYKILPDANVALMNLRSGQVDITNRFPFNETSNFKNDSKILVVNQPAPGFRGFMFNVTKAPFSKYEVGQAIEALIDREAIAKVVLNGAGTPGRSPFPPGNFAYSDAIDKPVKPDLEKAKALLANAGFPTGFSFTLKTDTDPVTQQVGQMIQNMLKPVGIEVILQKLEFGTLLDQAKSGNFEAASISWSGRLDPDQNIYDWYVTNGSLNYMKYSNKEVDRLLSEARSTIDEGKRKALYDQVMQIVHTEVSYIFLYHEHNVFGLDKSVKDFIYFPDGMIRTMTLNK